MPVDSGSVAAVAHPDRATTDAVPARANPFFRKARRVMERTSSGFANSVPNIEAARTNVTTPSLTKDSEARTKHARGRPQEQTRSCCWRRKRYRYALGAVRSYLALQGAPQDSLSKMSSSEIYSRGGRLRPDEKSSASFALRSAASRRSNSDVVSLRICSILPKAANNSSCQRFRRQHDSV